MRLFYALGERTAKTILRVQEPVRRLPRLGLRVDFLWGLVEIPEQRRAQPALELVLLAPIPVAAEFGAPPFQLHGIAGKGLRGEEELEALLGVGNGRRRLLNHQVDAQDQRLLPQARRLIIKDPLAVDDKGEAD